MNGLTNRKLDIFLCHFNGIKSTLQLQVIGFWCSAGKLLSTHVHGKKTKNICKNTLSRCFLFFLLFLFLSPPHPLYPYHSQLRVVIREIKTDWNPNCTPSFPPPLLIILLYFHRLLLPFSCFTSPSPISLLSLSSCSFSSLPPPPLLFTPLPHCQLRVVVIGLNQVAP